MAGLAVLVVVLVLAAAFVATRGSSAGSTTAGSPTSTAAAAGATPANPPSTTIPAPTTTAAATDWAAWSPDDRSFTVEFPGDPETRTSPGDGTVATSVNSAHVAGDDTLHQVAWWVLKPNRSVKDPTALVNTILDQWSGTVSLDIRTRTTTRFAGTSAVAFAGQAEIKGESFAMEGVVFASGGRIYLLDAAARPGAPVAFERFRDTFRISKGA